MLPKSERGAILKALRKEAGVSQFAVAVGTGLQPKTLYLLEAGRVATIRAASAEKLAQFYSTKLDREIKPDELGYQVGRVKKEQDEQ